MDAVHWYILKYIRTLKKQLKNADSADLNVLYIVYSYFLTTNIEKKKSKNQSF